MKLFSISGETWTHYPVHLPSAPFHSAYHPFLSPKMSLCQCERDNTSPEEFWNFLARTSCHTFHPSRGSAPWHSQIHRPQVTNAVFPLYFWIFMIGHLWLFGYLWLNWIDCKIKCKVQWIIKYNKSLSFGYPKATSTESEFWCQRESKDHTDEETEAWGEDWLAQRHIIRNKSWRSRTSSPGLNSDDRITQ